MAGKLKVGIVGAGGISHAHLPNLQKNENVELTCIADVNAETAKATAEKYGVANVVSDYKELIPQVDSVLICVPTFLHRDIALAALNAGKPVFSEKPLARTIEEGEEIAAAAKRNNVPLQIGFVRRFDEEWLAWRAAIQGGAIGKPVVWRDTQAGPGPIHVLWYNQEEKGGGPFLDGCIHNFDFALHTFGEAEWAFCHGRSLRDVSTAIDTGTATVRFKSGDELMLAWSWGLPAGVFGSRSFEFLGPKGLLDARPVEEGSDELAYTARLGGSEFVKYPYPANALNDAFRDQMTEFVEVARGNAKPRAGAQEGLDSLRLALAVLKSGRSGQVEKV